MRSVCPCRWRSHVQCFFRDADEPSPTVLPVALFSRALWLALEGAPALCFLCEPAEEGWGVMVFLRQLFWWLLPLATTLHAGATCFVLQIILLWASTYAGERAVRLYMKAQPFLLDWNRRHNRHVESAILAAHQLARKAT